VIVIGGGPAGSTAAALLAARGRRVVLLEKEKFPRYHIGESLIPYSWFTLNRLGVLDRMRRSHFPKKYSVQFVSTSGRLSIPFYFNKHTGEEHAQTWQVLRSEFDQLLLDNAREKGAVVHEETLVRDALLHDGFVVGVRAVTRQGVPLEFRAPITIDGSGRDAFTMARRGWMKRDPQLNKVAVWNYFRGARREPGIDEGATTVAYLPEKGWFWYIPLPGDVVSVGVVAEREYLQRDTTDPEKIYLAEIQNNPWIRDNVTPGRIVDRYRVTSEFSYRSRHCAAGGVVLAGDAFAFLDPVFSSGVFLALLGGELASDAVESALVARDYSASRFEEYGRGMCRGIEAMRKLVYAFYDRDFSFNRTFTRFPHIRHDLTECLIGGVFHDFAELWSRVGEMARLPADLPYGEAADTGRTAAGIGAGVSEQAEIPAEEC
jgi:flavin-dependent dehydrogenase